MLNVVALVGRFTKDPELKYTQGNVPVCSFSVAVDRSYVKQGAERQTDFINIVAWRSTAEFICKHFHRGSLIGIEGSLQSRRYTDKEGKGRTAFDVVTDKVHFVERKGAEATEIAAPGDFVPVEIDVEADEDLPF